MDRPENSPDTGDSTDLSRKAAHYATECIVLHHCCLVKLPCTAVTSIAAIHASGYNNYNMDDQLQQNNVLSAVQLCNI